MQKFHSKSAYKIRTFRKSAFVRLSDKALGSELFFFKNFVRVAFESIAKLEVFNFGKQIHKIIPVKPVSPF